MDDPNHTHETNNASPSPSFHDNIYDDIGLDPRAAEKLKILVNDLNVHIATLSEFTAENPDGTVRDGFSEEFSVRFLHI